MLRGADIEPSNKDSLRCELVPRLLMNVFPALLPFVWRSNISILLLNSISGICSKRLMFLFSYDTRQCVCVVLLPLKLFQMLAVQG